MIIHTLGKILKTTKQQIGLAPDDLVFKGEQKMDRVKIHFTSFNDIGFKMDQEISMETLPEYIKKDGISWINVYGLHDADVIKSCEEVFDIKRFILADTMDTTSRPKLAEYEDCLFISIKMIKMSDQTKTFQVEHLSFIAMDTALLVFQEREGDVFDPVRARIKKNFHRFHERGTMYLTFALLDVIIDNYLFVLSSFDEYIIEIEERINQQKDAHVIEDIYSLKRKLTRLRKNIFPAKDLIFSATRMENEYIDEKVKHYFDDLLHNINQAIDAMDHYREILTEQLNTYHTALSSRLNDTMKFLTIFSVVFIPLTFIAGIYGTNFDVLPELHFRYSYFIMWLVMIAIATGMLIYFKRKKWF